MPLSTLRNVGYRGLASCVPKNVVSNLEDCPPAMRGEREYDRFLGDHTHSPSAALGTVEEGPYYAVPISVGAMGTKGGPRTDRDGRVLHVSGGPIPGLFAAGNAMGGVTGRAYGGAGGTIGPAMVFGFRAGYAAATGKPVD